MEKFKSENYENFGGINVKASPFNLDQTQFLNLVNLDFTEPGALTKRPGSANYLGSTVAGRITGLYSYEKLNGSSYLIATANTNAYSVTNVFSSIRTGLSDGAIFDFVTFVDRLFAANGSNFFVYDGNSSRSFGIPVPPAPNVVGISNAVGMSGTYIYRYAYLNDLGQIGGMGTGVTISVAAATNIILSGFTTIAGYGITSIAIFRTNPGLLQFARIGFVSGSTFVDNNLSLSNVLGEELLWFTLAPKYVELYNNQLFFAGFSSAPSTVFFSEIGQPEKIQAQNFFEVRTNDGDRITGLKTYNSQLIIFKEKSISTLTGDNPANFLLREISDEYGCLSNRAICIYEDYLTFLDKKGICLFNGANIGIMSNPIEPVFQAMNTSAALENATAIHFRSRNELWFSIPCDGSTFNNCTVVYDYLSKAFTKFEGFFPSALTVAKATFSLERCLYGGYTGNIVYFSELLTSDNSVGFTVIAKTRFLNNSGNSVTKQWRRLYLNVNVDGSSTPISCKLFADYGNTHQIERSIYKNQFQTRIDFGIPAKALAAEFFYLDPNSSLKLFGFTLEYRIQRTV
jgi:hypothetical protein